MSGQSDPKIEEAQLLGLFRNEVAMSSHFREELVSWLDRQNDEARRTVEQIDGEQPGPLAPVDEQAAFMRRTAQLVARLELLAELQDFIAGAQDEPLVVPDKNAEPR